MAYKIKKLKGKFWNDGTQMSEKDEVYGTLNSNKAIKFYNELRNEGFSHKVSLKLAKDEDTKI